MVEATIETKNGTKIIIDGAPEEVAKIMGIYKEVENKPVQEFKKFTKNKTNSSPSINDRIRELIISGFFNKPKGLADLKAGLEEQGHFFPITTLSGRILELVKGRELRRIKQNNTWHYVKP